MIRHIPTGKTYENRKEAKQDMGHAYFNLCWKRREFEVPKNRIKNVNQ